MKIIDRIVMKKNNILQKVLYIFFLICSVFLNACTMEDIGSAKTDNADGKSIPVVINISAIPAERSVYPSSLPSGSESWYYTVKAEDNAASPNTAAVETITPLSGCLASFTAYLTSTNTWTITVYAYTDAEKTTLAASGSQTVTPADDTSALNDILIYLKNTTGKGTIKLYVAAGNITLCSPSDIKMSATLTPDSGSAVQITPVYNAATKTISLNKTDIPAGAYTLTAIWSLVNENTVFTAARMEQCVIWGNFTTDTWNNEDGSESGQTITLKDSDFSAANYYVASSGTDATRTGLAGSSSGTGSVFSPCDTLSAAVTKINSASDGSSTYTVYIDGTVNESSSMAIAANIIMKPLYSTAVIKRTDTTASSLITVNNGKSLTATDITFNGGGNGKPDNGGCIYNSGTITLTKCILESFRAAAAGGALHNASSGTVFLYGCTIKANGITGTNTSNCLGGGIYNNGTMTIGSDTSGSTTTQTRIFNNYTCGSGGGIYSCNSDITFSGSPQLGAETAGTIYIPVEASYTTETNTCGNYAGTYGGGMYITVTKNASFCGTVYANSTATGTTSTSAGGGLYVAQNSSTAYTYTLGGTGTAKDCIIAGNSASSGGGICMSNGILDVNSGTRIGGDGVKANANQATVSGGGGIYVSSGTLNLNTGSLVGAEITEQDGTQPSGAMTEKYQTGYSASADFCANYAEQSGGGIAVSSGTVNMTGTAAVADNYAKNYGGGISVSSASLNIGKSATDNSSEIYGNGLTTSGNTTNPGIGGGVYVSGDKASVSIYGKIHHNIATSASGIEIEANATATMYDNAWIRDNKNTGTAAPNGSAVGFGTDSGYTNTFDMKGGTIKNNGSKNGDYEQYEVMLGKYGNYAIGVFKMSGSAAVVSSDYEYNSVCLPGTGDKFYITIEGNLNPAANTDAGKPLVSALITPSSYVCTAETSTCAVLSASSSTLITDNMKYFDTFKAGSLFTSSGTSGYINCVAQYYVSDSSSPYSYALEYATDSVASGKTVTLLHDITLNRCITINKKETVTTTEARTVSRGGRLLSQPLFSVNSSVYLTLNGASSSAVLTLDGKNLTNVKAPLVASTGALYFGNCTLQNNDNDSSRTAASTTTYDGNGGAVYLNNASGTVGLSDGTTIQGCKAYNGGGIYVVGTLGINDSTSKVIIGTKDNGNEAKNYGGGIYADITDSQNVQGGLIQYNTAGSYGGGLYIATDYSTGILNMSISNNSVTGSSGRGGGMYIYGSTSFTFDSLTIAGNSSAGNGGGVYVDRYGITFTDTTIGADITGTVSSANCSNKASCGGGIYVGYDPGLTLTGTTVKGNYSSGNGGGLAVESTSTPSRIISMDNTSAITNNAAEGTGGGVYGPSKNFTLYYVTGNSAGSSKQYFIHKDATLSVDGTSISTTSDVSQN